MEDGGSMFEIFESLLNGLGTPELATLEISFTGCAAIYILLLIRSRKVCAQKELPVSRSK